jgi:hypothetical protein
MLTPEELRACQGAGKSHTLACVLEGCLLPFKHEVCTQITGFTGTKEVQTLTLPAAGHCAVSRA